MATQTSKAKGWRRQSNGMSSVLPKLRKQSGGKERISITELSKTISKTKSLNPAPRRKKSDFGESSDEEEDYASPSLPFGKSCTEPVQSLPFGKSRTEPVRRQDSLEVCPLQSRTVMVRAVYSKARASLASLGSFGGLNGARPSLRSHTMDSLESIPDARPAKVMLRNAAKTIQKATKHTKMERSMVKVFLDVAADAKEKARLKEEMDRLAREAEESATWDDPLMRGTSSFLTSLLEELEFNRNSKGAGPAIPVQKVLSDLSEIMAKMEALKGMYAMNLRGTQSLTNQIDSLQKSIHRTLQSLNGNVEIMSTVLQGMGDDVVNELRDANPEPSITSETEEDKTRQESSRTVGQTSPQLPARRCPWRKAAIVVSFGSLLAGPLRAAQEAMLDVSQIAISCGHKPLELPKLPGIQPEDSNLEAGSPLGNLSPQSPRSPTPRKIKPLDLIRPPPSAMSSTPSGAPSSPTSPIRTLDLPGFTLPATVQTPVQQVMASKAMPHELDPLDTAEVTNILGSEPMLSPPTPPCSLSPPLTSEVQCIELGTDMSPSFPDPAVVPSFVDRTRRDDDRPMQLFTLPLPLVPAPSAPKRIFRRKASSSLRHRIKKDTTLTSLEMVLADREHRGVRDPFSD